MERSVVHAPHTTTGQSPSGSTFQTHAMAPTHRVHRRSMAVFAALLITVGPVATLRARDHWQTPSPSVRWLSRDTHWPDGADLHFDAVFVDQCAGLTTLRFTQPQEGHATVSRFANQTGALAAINGDYFDESTNLPLGPGRGAGVWWQSPHRMHRDALLIAGVGHALTLLTAHPGLDDLWTDANTRVPGWASEVVAAREQVLNAGVVQLSPRIPQHEGRHPRTGVGLSADGRTLILLAVDGRHAHSAGATALELGTLLRDLGAWNGFKMDGGGSTALYVRGHGVVNHPSDGHERAVANHLAVVPAPQGAALPSVCTTHP